MPKTSLRIIIISAIALLSCFILIFLLLNTGKFPFNLRSVSRDSTVQEKSAFGAISVNKDSTVDSESVFEETFDKFAGELKNQPDGKTIFGIGSGILPFDYFAEWNYTSTPFWAEVTEVLKDGKSLVLSFVQPQSMPYIGKNMKVEVVGCNESNSFMRIQSQQINAIAIDFWAQVTEEDDLIGYCLNAECTQVGKLCKIYRE